MTEQPVEGEVVEQTELVIAYPPSAGEVLDLRDTPKVGVTIREMIEWYRAVFLPVMETLRKAVLSEADRQGRYTLRYGPLEIKADSPNSVEREWRDPEALRRELVAAGLPEDRAYEVVEKKTTHSVRWGEAKKLLASPAYREIIQAHMVETPAKRYVQVKGVIDR